MILVVYFYELIVYMLLKRNAIDSIAFFSQCRNLILMLNKKIHKDMILCFEKCKGFGLRSTWRQRWKPRQRKGFMNSSRTRYGRNLRKSLWLSSSFLSAPQSYFPRTQNFNKYRSVYGKLKGRKDTSNAVIHTNFPFSQLIYVISFIRY